MAVRKVVINRVKRDHSFVSFNSALLVFLAVLLLIYLLLYLLTKPRNEEQKEYQESSLFGGYSQSNRKGIADRSSTTGDIVTARTEITTSHLQNISPSTNDGIVETSTGGTSFDAKLTRSTSTEIGTTSAITESYRPSSPNSTTTSTVEVTNADNQESFWTETAAYYESSGSKRTAANVLHLIDYGSKPCKDFYRYACGEYTISKRSPISADDVLKYASGNQSKPVEIFNSFYQICTEFHSKNRLDHLKALSSLGDEDATSDLTELIYQLILAQSMPFFDIGLTINSNSYFGIEITIQGSKSMRTNIFGWSMLEEIKSECLHRAIRDSSDMVTVNLEMSNCALDQTVQHIHQYTGEMKLLSRLFGVPSFENFLDYENDLIDVFRKLQEESAESGDSKSVELWELKFNENLDFGMNWTKLLQLFDNSIGDHTKIRVESFDYFSSVLKEFKNRQENIREILQLWRRIQQYYNMINVKENYKEYCWNLGNELMPDVAYKLVAEIATEDATSSTKMEKLLKLMFQTMKSKLKDSIETSWMESLSKTVTLDKLRHIELHRSEPMKMDELEKLYGNIEVTSRSYPQVFVQLLNRYRENILSLAGQQATPSKLGSYFLDPYQSRPRSFQPSNKILYQPVSLMFLNDEIPRYLTLAQNGFMFAQEIARNFEGEYVRSLSEKDQTKYGTYFDADYSERLRTETETWKYSFDGESYNITAQAFSTSLENTLMRETTAFGLISDLIKEQSIKPPLIWLNSTYSDEQIFLTMTAQEYCKPITMYDVARNFIIDKTIPAPLRLKILMDNSQMFSEEFKCTLTGNILGHFPHFTKVDRGDVP